MNASLTVDVVCDTQAELEDMIKFNGFQDEVVVTAWQPDGPGGGNAEATLYGPGDSVYTLALLLGYEEEIVLFNLVADDPDYEDYPPVDVDYTEPSIQ